MAERTQEVQPFFRGVVAKEGIEAWQRAQKAQANGQPVADTTAQTDNGVIGGQVLSKPKRSLFK